MEKSLDWEVLRAAETGCPLSLAVIDLDRFKHGTALVGTTDEVLYQAKHDGRNRSVKARQHGGTE